MIANECNGGKGNKPCTIEAGGEIVATVDGEPSGAIECSISNSILDSLNKIQSIKVIESMRNTETSLDSCRRTNSLSQVNTTQDQQPGNALKDKAIPYGIVGVTILIALGVLFVVRRRRSRKSDTSEKYNTLVDAKEIDGISEDEAIDEARPVTAVDVHRCQSDLCSSCLHEDDIVWEKPPKRS